MTEWEFDVAVSSHDELKRGITVAGYVRVQVAAPDHCEASLVAAQMAAIVGMPTDVLDRI